MITAALPGTRTGLMWNTLMCPAGVAVTIMAEHKTHRIRSHRIITRVLIPITLQHKRAMPLRYKLHYPFNTYYLCVFVLLVGASKDRGAEVTLAFRWPLLHC